MSSSFLLIVFYSFVIWSDWDPPYYSLCTWIQQFPNITSINFMEVHIFCKICINFYCFWGLDISKWMTKTLIGVDVGTRVSRWNNLSGKQFHKWSFHQRTFCVLKTFTSPNRIYQNLLGQGLQGLSICTCIWWEEGGWSGKVEKERNANMQAWSGYKNGTGFQGTEDGQMNTETVRVR